MFQLRGSNLIAAAAFAAAAAAVASPAMAVLTPGEGVTIVPLTSYNAAVTGPQNSAGFTQTHLGFDNTGNSSFQLTSLTSIGDTVTYSGTFTIDANAADWNTAPASQGAHRSRLFLQAGVGSPLASPLPDAAQRNDHTQTPGVTMEYNTFGFDDNSNYDYLLDNVNQFPNVPAADLDFSNGAGPDIGHKGGVATLLTTIERTGASSFSWTSSVQYRYVDAPGTIIGTVSQTGALVLPGSVASTYFTPFNQLGIGDTTGAWSESITDSSLTFDIAAVPEPTGVALLGLGAGALLLRRRSRREA